MDLKNNNYGRISLKVVGQDGNEFLVLINVSKRMAILKQMFADRLGVPVTALRYLFDGKRIGDDETPAELQMENGDVIEVYQEQIGGFL